MRSPRKDTVVIGYRWCLYGDGLPIFSCLCFHSCLGSFFTKFYQNQRIRSHACFHWRELSSGAILYEIFSFLLRFVVQDSVTPCLPYVLYKSYGFGSYYFKFTNGGIVWRVPEHICVFKLRAHQRCCLQWWRGSLIDHNDSALCFVEGHFVLGWPANKRINVLLESDNGWAQWNPPMEYPCFFVSIALSWWGCAIHCYCTQQFHMWKVLKLYYQLYFSYQLGKKGS